ncbi:hypothetical protein HOV93_07720 [Planctomycetes bacterium FF15]|uniref:Uncharacterized protein n=1 Tax=Bremerella alba TaxID=980252 RepID=A0A7V8V2A9_9BACT|nr:hypothetical protein [Bremerella alba]
MPCDWKATLRQFVLLIDPVSEDSNNRNRTFAPHFAGAICRQKHAPSATPPPWLSRRNKCPAQRKDSRSA